MSKWFTIAQRPHRPHLHRQHACELYDENQWPKNLIKFKGTTATNRKMWFLFRSRLIALPWKLVCFRFYSSSSSFYRSETIVIPMAMFHCLYDDKCDDFLGSNVLSPSPLQRCEKVWMLFSNLILFVRRLLFLIENGKIAFVRFWWPGGLKIPQKQNRKCFEFPLCNYSKLELWTEI